MADLQREDPTLVEDEATEYSDGWSAVDLTMPATIGPYAIESELGHGGMSVVYRATRSPCCR